VEITIKSDLFIEEQRQNLIIFLEDQIKNFFGKNLKIETLESIIVTNKFFEDVLNFQERHQLYERGATNNEDGSAVAKVLKRKDVSEVALLQTIFINDQLICGLFGDQAQSVFHYIHHEMCHVHDNFNLEKIYTDGGKRGLYIDTLRHITNTHASIIWSEYFAERASVLTINELNINFLLENFFNSLKKVKLDVKNEIILYRQHGNIDILFKFVQEKTSLLLKFAAMLIGTIHGINHLNNVENNLKSMVEEEILNEHEYFIETWNELNISLGNLYNNYPNWNDVYELGHLGDSVLSCWMVMGIFPSNTSEGLYIKVL
jgi:hypothetical protein